MGSALMAADENRVYMALGVIQSELATLRDEFRDLEEKTTIEHRKVHDIVVATSEAIRNLTRVIDEMKPLTDDYREKRAEARGAAKLAGWLYTAAGVIGGAVAYIGGKIIEWVASRPHIPVIAMIALLIATALASAQQNHRAGHGFYQHWENKKGQGCCNDNDCGELPEANERTTSSGVEVFVEGQWCPVHSDHYLRRGNAPNWAVAHVCVQKMAIGRPVNPCDRLLCYQPKPAF